MRGRFLGRVPSCTFLPACAAERSTISGLTKPGLSAIAAHHPCILDTAPFNNSSFGVQNSQNSVDSAIHSYSKRRVMASN